ATRLAICACSSAERLTIIDSTAMRASSTEETRCTPSTTTTPRRLRSWALDTSFAIAFTAALAREATIFISERQVVLQQHLHRLEAAAVDRAGPAAAKRREVLGGRVPLVAGEAIAGILGVQARHLRVARDLGEDRG